MFDLVIFDLDGTLVDSAPDIAAALDATLGDLGLPTLGVDRVRGIVGDGATRLVERALPAGAAARLDVAAVVARFRERYAAHLYERTRPYPGIAEVLAAMAARAVVLTNKPGDLARALLDGLGLSERFFEVIGDGDGFPRKPAPDAAQAVAARVGATADRILVVGDGLPDLRLGPALGAAVAAAAWGYVARSDLAAENPRWLLDNPLQLLAILAG